MVIALERLLNELPSSAAGSTEYEDAHR